MPEVTSPMNTPAAPKVLLACPFCGKSNTAIVTTLSELQGDSFDESNTDYYTVVCDASSPGGPGGCGGSGPLGITEVAAVSHWQRRIDAPPIVKADDIDLMEHAACLLDGEALSMRMSHNVDFEHPDWKDEPVAKKQHDDMKDTAEALYTMADRLRARATATPPATQTEGGSCRRPSGLAVAAAQEENATFREALASIAHAYRKGIDVAWCQRVAKGALDAHRHVTGKDPSNG